jgi:predicted secreted protein
MNSEVKVQSTFCNQYDTLLHECESAQRSWSEWREEMNTLSSKLRINKEVSDELLRLQAKFAKAYARLETHHRECELCQFAARMAEERGEYACVPASAQQAWPA